MAVQFSGAKLRAVRHARGWNTETVATKSGHSNSTVVRAEMGTSSPRVDVLTDIANALDVDIAEFFEYTTGSAR